MRKLLQQFKKIVFFDAETTGLNPEKDQIIELAAALVTENGIELKIDAFCKLPEGEKIPEKIVELTHITDDMLADKGIDYREACRIFCNMLHSDSEQAVMKTGITTKDNVLVPNPVNLIPYRTFLEVEQPASDFVFRVSEGRGGAPVFKLVAADGGVWKSQAVANVKAYLTEALKDIPDRDKITIIA